MQCAPCWYLPSCAGLVSFRLYARDESRKAQRAARCPTASARLTIPGVTLTLVKFPASEGRESESVKRNLHWQLATFACLLNGFFPEVDGLDPSSGSCTYPVVLPCMAAGCPVTISAHI
jgi:hypothetical protein